MPFDAGGFDGAVTFHVAMNIDDRARFYAELARVIRPGGFLCIFDVMKGPEPGVPFPMPWAVTEASSFLKTPEETTALVEDAGFEVTGRKCVRAYAIGYFQKAFAAIEAEGPAPLGLHLLTGAETPAKFRNAYQAMVDEQTDPVILTARRV